MTAKYDLSRLCRDTFVLLSGATKIEYRDGSAWRAEDDEREHPILAPLRAASLASLIEEPQFSGERNPEHARALFISRIEEICARHGAPTDSGDRLLDWLAEKLA